MRRRILVPSALIAAAILWHTPSGSGQSNAARSPGAAPPGQTVIAATASPRVITSFGPEVFRTRVVATGFEGPWSVVWGPDGHLWIDERTGKRIVRVNPVDGSRTPAATIDEVHRTLGQDGLLGLALHPDLLAGKGRDYVYAAYTYDADSGPEVALRMKLRRYNYDKASQRVSAPLDILTNLPHGTDHGGGRLIFGPDGKLYLSRGDHGANFLANYCLENRAQDLPTAVEIRASDWSSYQGKILRINPDGSIPSDNPMLNGVRSHIYSYGHRNPQGMAFGPGGRLFASEHGESVDDEMNVIKAGRNYGWPLIAGYQDDQSYAYANWSKSSPEDCKTLTFNVLKVPASVPRQRESDVHLVDFEPPAQTFFTVPNSYDLAKLSNSTVAPGGVSVYTSNAIPGWRNSVLMSGMLSGVVFRMPITSDARRPLGQPVAYFRTGNRIRDLVVAPDGLRIYAVTDSGSRVIDTSGAPSRTLANPGSLLEFAYERAR